MRKNSTVLGKIILSRIKITTLYTVFAIFYVPMRRSNTRLNSLCKKTHKIRKNQRVF